MRSSFVPRCFCSSFHKFYKWLEKKGTASFKFEIKILRASTTLSKTVFCLNIYLPCFSDTCFPPHWGFPYLWCYVLLTGTKWPCHYLLNFLTIYLYYRSFHEILVAYVAICTHRIIYARFPKWRYWWTSQFLG